MGNNPSAASKPGTPGTSSPHETAKQSKRDSKNIFPVHTTQRIPAPPEPSLTQAQGSTATSRPNSLPHSIPAALSSLSGSSPSISSNHSAPLSRPPEPKPVPRDGPTQPVDVPTAPIESDSARPQYSAHVVEVPLVSQSSMGDLSYLTRPPRLPLPIEEEVHTPGSPIITPAEVAEAVGDVEGLDSDGATAMSSTLSTTAPDEEDDAEELPVDKTQPTVPTRLEWKHGGDKVYVTGTIFHWNKKKRLHAVPGKPGVFAATIPIFPGTHHVRFLVDGIMQTCPDLPTTVDFGNNLVNYIEVSADDVPAATISQGAGAKPSLSVQQQSAPPGSDANEEAKRQRETSVPSLDEYLHQIPKYLVDFDQPEDAPAYQYAVNAIEKLPTPPSLPGFLGKPILNAAVLIKDDNSVLNMPNHTTLNHLATSSIKYGILAVSATTRYKHKYVTTIIYKPTNSAES